MQYFNLMNSGLINKTFLLAQNMKFLRLCSLIMVACGFVAVYASENIAEEDKRRFLRTHDQKEQKYKHWLATKDLPEFEKTQEYARRNTDYSRRSNQKEERMEKWKDHTGRFSDDPETAEHELKVEVASKTKTLWTRRQGRYQERCKIILN
jgi:Skp family chaperone for outer membrane proteins